MKPFFSYYGSKYSVSKYLGPPRCDTVVEPFAGSACYSTRWNCRKVRLYDLSDDICVLWDFLINCSVNDIAKIPSHFDYYDDVDALEQGAKNLVRFWIAKGRAEPSNNLSPWYLKYRGSSDCKVWGDAVKRRLIEQKPLISEWTIRKKSWKEIDTFYAHWHIDPPYSNSSGSRYPNSDIDYIELANWCKSLPGHVDVCENVGADWLDFSFICDVSTSRGKRSGVTSSEALWRRQ